MFHDIIYLTFNHYRTSVDVWNVRLFVLIKESDECNQFLAIYKPWVRAWWRLATTCFWIHSYLFSLWTSSGAQQNQMFSLWKQSHPPRHQFKIWKDLLNGKVTFVCSSLQKYYFRDWRNFDPGQWGEWIPNQCQFIFVLQIDNWNEPKSEKHVYWCIYSNVKKTEQCFPRLIRKYRKQIKYE